MYWNIELLDTFLDQTVRRGNTSLLEILAELDAVGSIFLRDSGRLQVTAAYLERELRSVTERHAARKVIVV